MCGIVGLINERVPVDRHLISEGTATLYKRGPDDGNIWTEDGVGLGHRRLAILDITEAGSQPMVSSDGRYVIVFNGEIYNFMELRHQLGETGKWRSHSDTEVILTAYGRWGVDCVKHFHGMFAFAIWDRHAKKRRSRPAIVWARNHCITIAHPSTSRLRPVRAPCFR